MYTQYLTTIQKVLKECFLPAWQNQLAVEPTPFLSKIKKVPLAGHEIVSTAPIGLSGGYGGGREGAPTPKAGKVNYERFKSTSKDQYVNICISEKAVALGSKSSGSMINAVEAEINAGYETAKWNTGRILFGNGSGKIANITEAEGSVVTVDSTKNVKEGLIVDLYKIGTETIAETRRIVAVNRVSGTITLDKELSAYSGAGFMAVQNSYKTEFTGVGAIFDDDIDEIYGIKKSENIWLKPIDITVDDGNITDGLITKTLRRAKTEKGSNIDTILCGNDAYDAYVEYLRSTNNRNEVATHDMVGGFQAITFKFGNKIIDVVNEEFVPDGEMWGVDSSVFELHQTDWDFATLQGGDIFNLLPDQSVYRALLRNYGELICNHPGGCFRIGGITA